MTIADLPLGSTAVITKIDHQNPSIIKLMQLGIVEGITIHIENVAIGGDPIEVSFLGNSICLNKELAQYFKVEYTPEA